MLVRHTSEVHPDLRAGQRSSLAKYCVLSELGVPRLFVSFRLLIYLCLFLTCFGNHFLCAIWQLKSFHHNDNTAYYLYGEGILEWKFLYTWRLRKSISGSTVRKLRWGHVCNFVCKTNMQGTVLFYLYSTIPNTNMQKLITEHLAPIMKYLKLHAWLL